MADQNDIEKRFLDRLNTERDANRTRVAQQAQLAEDSFKSIIETAMALSSALSKLNKGRQSVRTQGFEEEDNGDYSVSVYFNNDSNTKVVKTTLISGTSGRPELRVTGLNENAIEVISAPRKIRGTTDICTDTNQGFEIAKALEEFAVKFFGSSV